MRLNRTIGGVAAIAVLTLFFTPLGNVGTVRAERGRTKPETYETLSARQSVPMKLYRNFLPVAEGEVGGIPESQNFILDTGTAPSVISLSVARRLGLATAPSSFVAAGTVAQTQMAVMPEIDLGPIRAVSLRVRVQDLSQLESDFGTPVAGILGMDVLSKSSFRLDYGRGEISFGESSREGIAAPFDARAGIAVLSLTLQGKPAHLLVDTGSEHVVVFGKNFATGSWKGLRNLEQTGTTLADRKIAIQQLQAPDIFVGTRRFRTDAAYLVGASADPVFDGLLAPRALGFRSLSYDAISKTIYLQN